MARANNNNNMKRKGKEKMEIEFIESQEEGLLTFSKRKARILKKANDWITGGNHDKLSDWGSKPYSFGHPSTDAIIKRLLGQEKAREMGGLEVEAKQTAKINVLNNQLDPMLVDAEQDKEKSDKLTECNDAGEGEAACWTNPNPIEQLNKDDLIEAMNMYNEVRNPPRVQYPRDRWAPPATGRFKVNTKADLSSTGVGQIGAVIRDSRGVFLAAGVRSCPFQSHPVMLEALGMKLGVDLACSLGLKNVVFESDYMPLVSALQGTNHSDLNDLSEVVDDCHEGCRAISAVLFSFVHKEANAVAHAFAKMHMSGDSLFSFFSSPPEGFDLLLSADIS